MTYEELDLGNFTKGLLATYIVLQKDTLATYIQDMLRVVIQYKVISNES